MNLLQLAILNDGYDTCEYCGVMVKWSIINTNANGNHFIELLGEAV